MTRFNRSFARGRASFKRERTRIPSSGKAFLIVTEGGKTEPNYLIKLRDRLKLAVADVEIVHPEGTDPITLTKRAIELREERKEEARRNPTKVAYDEVWVIFDLEKPHDERRELARKAKNIKGASKIRFAISDPCFEYWLLLHEKYTTSPFIDCSELTKKLKQHWKDYSKGQSPSREFLDKIPKAVTNARHCREHHKSSGGNGNPSTDMDFIICSLNGATRLHLQFKLD